MKDLPITTEHCGNEYNAGKVRVTKVHHMVEAAIQINAEFVIENGSEEELRDEIQEVIRRYAI